MANTLYVLKPGSDEVQKIVDLSEVEIDPEFAALAENLFAGVKQHAHDKAMERDATIRSITNKPLRDSLLRDEH